MTERTAYIKSRFFAVWIFFLMDVGLSVLASLFAVLFVRWVSDPFGSLNHFLSIWLLSSLVCSVVGFLVAGTHRIVIRHSTLKSIGKLILATLYKELLFSAFILLRIFRLFHLDSFGLETFVLMMDALLTLFTLISVRVLMYTVVDMMSSATVEENVQKLGVLVGGTGAKSVSLLTRLATSPHYNVLGFITTNPALRGQVIQDKTVYAISNDEELASLKAKLGVDGIIFSPENNPSDLSPEVPGMCIQQGIHLLNSPRIDEVRYGSMSQQAIMNVSRKQDEYIPDGMTSLERNFKRIVDCILAAVLLVIFSPLFLICFIAIKLDDGGPAIYKQERIGRFGRPFFIFKFRSMRTDAEAAGPALLDGMDDPRLTKVGKFLRAHHLDELPQLWNVFRGDMAFIGYRPERKFYIDQIMEVDPRYYYLYQIRPGVTSYATLYNGYTDSVEKMVKRLEYDLYYLRHRSAWFDIKILFLTFVNIVFGKKF